MGLQMKPLMNTAASVVSWGVARHIIAAVCPLEAQVPLALSAMSSIFCVFFGGTGSATDLCDIVERIQFVGFQSEMFVCEGKKNKRGETPAFSVTTT